MDALITSLKGLRVAVIGDIILDHYVWGNAKRISPEAPVPVVDVSRDTYIPGGAANVALNVSSLGGKAILCGRTGNDDAGEELSKAVHAAGVSYDPRFGRNDASTILKTRVIAGTQQICRLDREEAPNAYSLEDEDNIWALVQEKIKHVDAVIFSDYSKGIVTSSLVERVQEITAGKGVFLSMDPKPRRLIQFSGLDLMTPNRAEAIALSNLEVGPDEVFPADEICQILWQRYKPKHLVITLGSDGMLLSKEGSAVKRMPTMVKEIYDISGAGDTVIAALTSALARGNSFSDAAHFANLAAGVVIGKVGTATVSPEEILNYMEVKVEPTLF